jgi:hypothetical protein
VNNYIIVTDMESNIRIYRLSKGHGSTHQLKWNCSSRRWGKYHFHGLYQDPRAVIYQHIKLQFLFRFLDSLKNFCAFTCILCVSDSGLQCNKHISYWYGGQYLNRQTALGSWYRPWKWYFPHLLLEQFHFCCRNNISCFKWTNWDV